VADFALSELPDAQRPAAERGDLDVRDRALARIVEHAATSVPGSVRHSSTLDKLRGRSHPHADVQVQGSRAWVDLEVAATWPCLATELVESVRGTVLNETRRLSGLDVMRVDVRLHLVDPDRVDEPAARTVR